jgi:hypothetical protein
VAGCADAPDTTAPGGLPLRPNFAVGDDTDNTPVLGVLKVCKLGNVNGTFTVVAVPDPDGSDGSVLNPAVIAPGDCTVVATDSSLAGMGSNVSATEDPATDLVSITGTLIVAGGGISPIENPTNGMNLFLNIFHGYVLTYTNTFVPPPPPPPGEEGCTPGYWKNHADSWVPTGYSPAQTVGSVFTGSLYDSSTLLEALNFGGGSGVAGAQRILLRAAVAGLLNAANPDVEYTTSVADLIDDVNAALASGDRDTILALAAEIDADNNLGCPLN